MRKALLIALVLALALCTASAWAQVGPGGPGPGGPGGPGAGDGRGARMGGAMMPSPASALMPPVGIAAGDAAVKLQLTDEQKTKLQDVFAKFNEALRPLMTKATENSQELRRASMAATYDGQKVKDLIAAGDKNAAEIVALNLDTWTKVRAILTADQLVKLPDAIRRRNPGAGNGQRNPRPAGAPIPNPPPPPGAGQ